MIQNFIFENLFLKIFFSCIQLFYSSTRSSGYHLNFFFNFRFSSRKSQSQKKTSLKDHSFYNTVSLKTWLILWTLTHLTLKMICSRKIVKSLSDLANFPANVSVWCQKKHLHCAISWSPRTAFLKHFESKCLYFFFFFTKVPIVKGNSEILTWFSEKPCGGL